VEEKEYLSQYDPKRYDTPIISVDSVLFTCHEKKLKVLLTQRNNHPFQYQWSLPGGFLDLKKDHSLEETALRKIKEKTDIKPPYIEQLVTISSADRDPRHWSIVTCYFALISYQDCAKKLTHAIDAKWFEISKIDNEELAFDHVDIIKRALNRLQQKSLYSIIAAFSLSPEFTLPELQEIHEIILGKFLNKMSFRRRIEKASLLEEVGVKKSANGRPSVTYRMKESSKDYTFIRNLEV
jgi:8-oxo-dGTP diphosphatase